VKISVAAYPWDVARLSPAAVLTELASLGIARLDLSATYHPIEAVSPRGDPVSLFSLDRGAVFFPADNARYQEITPRVWSDPTVLEVWTRLAELSPGYGIEVRPWVIALFQPWIADLYPACRRVLPSGQPVPGSVCPASHAVRAYTAELCRDVVDQTDAVSLRLEAVSLTELTHQWARPRYLVDLSPVVRKLLSLCFCAGCTAAAFTAGIDAPALQRRVCEAIRGELTGSGMGAGAHPAAALLEDDQLMMFLASGRRQSEQLVTAIVSSIRNGVQHRRVLITTTPRDTTSPLDPFPLDSLVGVVDGFIVHPRRNPSVTRHLVARRADTARPFSLSAFVMAGADGSGGIRTHQGESSQDNSLLADLSAAAEVGVDEVGIYNFGLVDPPTLRLSVELARKVAA
jgi:hypothetical protein